MVRREREDCMCCHIRSASVSRRRRIKVRQAPMLPPLAMLDLSKPGELQAHEFLPVSYTHLDVYKRQQ